MSNRPCLAALTVVVAIIVTAILTAFITANTIMCNAEVRNAGEYAIVTVFGDDYIYNY